MALSSNITVAECYVREVDKDCVDKSAVDESNKVIVPTVSYSSVSDSVKYIETEENRQDIVEEKKVHFERERLRSFKTKTDLRCIEDDSLSVKTKKSGSCTSLDSSVINECSSDHNSNKSSSPGYEEIKPPLPPRPYRLRGFTTTSEPSTSSLPRFSHPFAAFRKRVKSAPSEACSKKKVTIPGNSERSNISKTFRRMMSVFKLIKKPKNKVNDCAAENTHKNANFILKIEDCVANKEQIYDDVINIKQDATAWLSLPKEIEDSIKKDKEKTDDVNTETKKEIMDVADRLKSNAEINNEPESFYMPMRPKKRFETSIEDIYVEMKARTVQNIKLNDFNFGSKTEIAEEIIMDHPVHEK